MLGSGHGCIAGIADTDRGHGCNALAYETIVGADKTVGKTGILKLVFAAVRSTLQTKG